MKKKNQNDKNFTPRFSEDRSIASECVLSNFRDVCYWFALSLARQEMKIQNRYELAYNAQLCKTHTHTNIFPISHLALLNPIQ